MWGIDRLSGGQLSSTRKRLRNGGSAVLTHAAAVDRRGRTTLEVLTELGVEPRVVFSPEHGLHGVAQAEEAVLSETIEGRPPLVSLYGSTLESLRPDAAVWEGVETLVIDLVDIGSRYYTYVWTALLAARAAAERGIHTVVLDRPNPLSGDASLAEGKAQSREFLSLVGLEPLPIRHSLTLGEILAHFFDADGKQLGAEGALSVVSCWGWERNQTAAAWNRPFVPPSPNMPTLETAQLYPGACLIEGTNLSEGRGTSYPFRVVGAPFLDADRLSEALRAAQLPGVMIRPAHFRPSFEKHAGQVCHGVMLHVTDARSFRPVTTYLTLVALAQSQAPDSFQFLNRVYEFVEGRYAFDLLTGSSDAREAILRGAPAEEVCSLIAPVGAEHAEFVEAAEARLEQARA
jgi:uncharacterized protein YbbC (DUF1343 family)